MVEETQLWNREEDPALFKTMRNDLIKVKQFAVRRQYCRGGKALGESAIVNLFLRCPIHSDSRYAIGCMNQWIYKWCRNAWVNAAGLEVANRDSIQFASDLDDRVKELGDVEYVWVLREENEFADE